MYTDMEMWRDIRRRVLVEGESKRSIMEEYGLHFSTLKKILTYSNPPGYRCTTPRAKRKLGPYLPIIEEILRADKDAPKKQRHTAQRIFERLQEEYGYPGGYTMVRLAVRDFKRQRAEVFMPLCHPPGEAQVDFGQAQVDLQGARTRIALFVMTLPYSDALFVCVFPRECTETFQCGHERAFDFFGAVPKRITYDNTKIAVKKIVGPRERKLTDAFLRLQSHFLFQEHFCRVRRANEKGHVESLLGYGRRNFLVPLPRIESLEALNKHLLERCRADLSRHLRGKEGPKASLLEEERRTMMPIPKHRFESRRIEQAQANSLSLVRFDCNDYSVPTACAHHEILGVGTLEEVRFIKENRVVARHERCWERHKIRYNPLHYLALLERKPGALDYARPLEQWKLPECFDVLRRRLEAEMDSKGTREYIKVLRLLESLSLSELTVAIKQALSMGATSCDAIQLIASHRREKPLGLFCLDGRPHLKAVRLERIDLLAYKRLRAEGE